MIYLTITMSGERKYTHPPDVINRTVNNSINNLQHRERPNVPVNIRYKEISNRRNL